MLYGRQVLGYQFNWGLYGFLALQTYYYARSSVKDPWAIKLFVGVLFIIETIQVILASIDSVLQSAPSDICVDGLADHDRYVGFMWLTICISSGLTSTLTRCVDARRIYSMSGYKAFATFTGIISVFQGAAAFTTGFQVLGAQGDLNERLHGLKSTSIWLGGNMACDLMILFSLAWILFKRRTGYESTNAVIRRVIFLIVIGYTTTALFTMATMILLYTSARSYDFVVPALLLSKLYSNFFLMLLNSRPSRSQSLGNVEADIETGLVFENKRPSLKAIILDSRKKSNTSTSCTNQTSEWTRTGTDDASTSPPLSPMHQVHLTDDGQIYR